jgi:hypothetical protein
VIYLITPNYNREAQLADLKTLINTLWIVPKVVWIVIEDSANKTFRVQKILKSSNLSFVHLNVATPEENKVKKGEKSLSKPRGVLQRNEGLKWLRDHSNELQRGVIYFMLVEDGSSVTIKTEAINLLYETKMFFKEQIQQFKLVIKFFFRLSNKL